MQYPSVVIPKNATEEIRVELSEFNNFKLFALRVWTQTGDGTEVPTRKGITIRIELLDDVINALEVMREQAAALEWMPLLEDEDTYPDTRG